jgi:uncharacterized membrane protein
MADWSDEQLDIRMGRVLRWGVLLAASVMLAAAAVFLYHYGAGRPDYRVFADGKRLQGLRGIFGAGQWGDGTRLIQLAVLFIILTPIARVVFAAYGFFRQRDWVYVSVSLIVLSFLMYGLTHAT